jgi:hypothetical protein
MAEPIRPGWYRREPVNAPALVLAVVDVPAYPSRVVVYATGSDLEQARYGIEHSPYAIWESFVLGRWERLPDPPPPEESSR